MIERKKLGLIILILFSFFVFINLVEPSIFSRFIFTMRAVSSTFSLSVVINSGIPPNITIFEPQNRTYVNQLNMRLGYRIVGDGVVNSMWFNINNRSNTTLDITKNLFYFNASLGNNTLYFFTNDTQGNINNTVFLNFNVGKYNSYNNNINSSGGLYFNDSAVNDYIKSINGLNNSWIINITLYGNNTPSNWTKPSNVGNDVLYFEILASANDTTGNYNLYFNLSKGLLGGVDPNNIRVYFNNNGWSELSTSVEDNSGDPIQFKAILTHLSQFLIGEKISTNGGSSGGSGGEGGGGAGGRIKWINSSEKGKTPEKPSEKIAGNLSKKPEEKKPTSLMIPRFEPANNLSIKQIISYFLLLVIIIFLLYYSYFISKHSMNTKKSRYYRIIHKIRTILFLLLIIVIIYYARSFSGITGNVVENISSNGNISIIITLIMLVLAINYFFRRKL